MAAADVLLPDMAAQTLEQSSVFTHKVAIQTAAVVPDAPATAPTTIDKEYFILNSQAFIDLQVYIKAALRLPGSKGHFELEFPSKMFANYQDNKTPVLYELMRDTLVDISTHCFTFQNDTMNPMISLAGYIGNYAGTAGERSAELLAQMQIIQAGSSKLEDQKVKAAVEEAMTICGELSEQAHANNKRCQAFLNQLAAFRTTTGIDKNNLETLNARSSVVLPSTAHLNEDLRKKMEIARKQLNALVKIENTKKEEAKANSGVRWYYFVPYIGWGLAIADTVHKGDAENAVRAAQQSYEQVANEAGEALATAISFREKCKHLTDLIEDVHKSIEAAETALTSMTGAFSKLETDLDDIANKLDTVKKYVSAGSDVKTKMAFKRLKDAGDKWTKVSSLAKDFQQTGLLMEASIKKEGPPDEPSPSLEIKRAHYGGIEYTPYAQILFNAGENLKVHSVEPGFPEAWEGVTKTISFMFVFGTEKRVFACTEYSGDHELKAGSIQGSQDNSSYVSAIEPRPKPAGSVVEILAIVWGATEVRKAEVDTYCYKQFHDGTPIEWKNENLGGDTWFGKLKSGAIYYTSDGGKTIQSVSGKENTSSGTT